MAECSALNGMYKPHPSSRGSGIIVGKTEEVVECKEKASSGHIKAAAYVSSVVPTARPTSVQAKPDQTPAWEGELGMKSHP